MMIDLRVNGRVVLAEEPIPRVVTESSGVLGRADDVGHEDSAVDAPLLGPSSQEERSNGVPAISNRGSPSPSTS